MDWLAAVDRSISSVVVSARSSKGDELGVRISIDGRLVAMRLDGKSIDLDPGIHRFRFELPPLPPIEQEVLIVEGDKNRAIGVTFVNPKDQHESAPTPERLSADYRPVPISVYVMGGLALAGIGGFTYFGVSGKHDRDALVQSCSPFCDSSSVGKVKTKLLLADIALGAATVSASVGLYLFLSRPASSSGDAKVATSLALEPGSQGARLLLRGQF